MGNQNCAEIYQVCNQNQSYGDYQLVKQNNKLIAVIQKNMEYCPELKLEVQEKLKKRLKLKSPHLIKLLKYQILGDKYSTSVKMYYEYISKTLTDRRNELKQKSQEFGQRQLFNIIYGVQSALEELEKDKIRHGCINMQTVLCQGNFYKITDVSSTTFVKSYDLVRRGCRKQYLSEKLLTNLQYKSLQPFYEIQDDYFSLGMIILSLVTGFEAKHFYIWKEKSLNASINTKNVESAISKLQRNYSSKLSRKVKALLKFDVEEEKSLQTNFTSLNNLNSQVQQLDRDIDRVLSKVALSSCSSSKKNELQSIKIHKVF